MSERDWRFYLKDISVCAARIVEYVGTMSREEFFHDLKTVDAVMRNLSSVKPPRRFRLMHAASIRL